MSVTIGVLSVFTLRELLKLAPSGEKAGVQAMLPFASVAHLLLIYMDLNETSLAHISYTLAFIIALIFITYFTISSTLFRISYIYILFSFCLFQCVLFSKFIGENYSFIYFFMSIVVITDTAGYVVGKFLGGPKPFKSISPKKTASGYLGGIVSALLLSYYWPVKYGLQNESFILFGGLLSLSVQIGDLLESIFKRTINVKDTGNLFPGHGGLLDRFDGFIASVFLIYVLSFFMNG